MKDAYATLLVCSVVIEGHPKVLLYFQWCTICYVKTPYGKKGKKQVSTKLHAIEIKRAK